MLFSLATLAKQAPAAPPAPKVTKSSALIDIRALVSATPKADASAKRADDVANLGGGGAFAPLFAPPVTLAPLASEETARRGRGPIVVGALALAFVAMVSVGALASVRARSSAPAAKAAPAKAAIATTGEVPSVGAPSKVGDAVSPAAEAATASTTPALAVAPVRTTRTSSVATPARSAARAKETPPVSTTTAAPKCCAGESELACQMRIATGARCEGAK